MKRYICNFQACCYKSEHSGNLVTHKRTHTGRCQCSTTYYSTKFIFDLRNL